MRYVRDDLEIPDLDLAERERLDAVFAVEIKSPIGDLISTATANGRNAARHSAPLAGFQLNRS